VRRRLLCRHALAVHEAETDSLAPPSSFWGPDGEKRYHAAYFEAYPEKKPAAWVHGDWVEVHSLTKGVMVFGRHVSAFPSSSAEERP